MDRRAIGRAIPKSRWLAYVFLNKKVPGRTTAENALF